MNITYMIFDKWYESIVFYFKGLSFSGHTEDSFKGMDFPTVLSYSG